MFFSCIRQQGHLRCLLQVQPLKELSTASVSADERGCVWTTWAMAVMRTGKYNAQLDRAVWLLSNR